MRPRSGSGPIDSTSAHPLPSDPFAVATVSTAPGFDSRLAGAAVRADNSVRLRKGTARVCLCVHESVCACMCEVRACVHVCTRVHSVPACALRLTSCMRVSTRCLEYSGTHIHAQGGR